MNIEKQIVDARIRKIVSDHPDWFVNINDEKQKMSKAFLVLAVSAYLNIRLDEAFGLVTEGSHDAGIDAIYIGEVHDYEFSVTIFQAKYVFDLDKESNFPANSISIVTSSINTIFNPLKKNDKLNPLLRAQVEEVKSRTLEYLPNIKCVFVNNGLKWKEDGQNHIDNFPSERVSFDYFNHFDMVSSTKKITQHITLQFAGKSFVENFKYKRVLVGKINVSEIARLFGQFGDALLESNIRKYLGSKKNSVNQAIEQTLTSDKKDNFYFYNNGVTMVCNKFNHNDLQTADWRVHTEGLQIINGGQSCKTISDIFKNYPEVDYSEAYILVRLYELNELTGTDDQLVNEVTLATNSQNPVDLRDLRANDTIQKNLILSAKELNYIYKPKRDIYANGDIIPSSVAAEAVYAIWRKKPHQAKFMQGELFGKFYYDIFNGLNGAQLVLAVLIYRYCDNQRRKEALIEQYPHIPYSNYFLSMIIASIVLKDVNIQSLEKLTHLNFEVAKTHFELNKEQLFERSNVVLIKALKEICPQGYETLELRRLSAIFRRVDLMDYIEI